MECVFFLEEEMKQHQAYLRSWKKFLLTERKLTVSSNSWLGENKNTVIQLFFLIQSDQFTETHKLVVPAQTCLKCDADFNNTGKENHVSLLPSSYSLEVTQKGKGTKKNIIKNLGF
jgi:hypothetical protein